MDLINLKLQNKYISPNITEIYLLTLYDNICQYLIGPKQLICIRYNHSLILCDDMCHLNIYDIIDNLTNIGKIIIHHNENVQQITNNISKELFDYLINLNSEDIIDMYTNFYKKYIDPTHLNICQYFHVIYYYLLFEKTMPPCVFNFFNTLTPEDERINNIIKIPNILMYLSMMYIQSKTIIINKEVIEKVNNILTK